MRLIIHLLIAIQLISWAAYMVFAYLGPEDSLPDQSIEGFIFICLIGVILCFLPALRMARRYDAQPFALLLTCLPIFAVVTVLIIQFA